MVLGSGNQEELAACLIVFCSPCGLLLYPYKVDGHDFFFWNRVAYFIGGNEKVHWIRCYFDF